MGTAKDIIDLVTQLSNNIQDRKVASELFNIISIANQIQSDMFALQKENLDLKKENQEIQKRLDDKNLKTIFHENLLWLMDDNDPYCPVCYDSGHKLIHMHIFPQEFKCPICLHWTYIHQHPVNKNLPTIQSTRPELRPVRFGQVSGRRVISTLDRRIRT